MKMDLWLKIDRPIDVEADLPLKDEAPDDVKKQYSKSNWGELVIWSNNENDSFGCIRYNRSITMLLSELGSIELQEMKPGRGRGYIHLVFISRDSNHLGGIYSGECTKKSFDWLSKIQPEIAGALNIEQKFSDHGYDA